jgi:hypothetical protein
MEEYLTWTLGAVIALALFGIIALTFGMWGAEKRGWGMNAESNQYTHGFCLNCNKIRPVRFSRIGNDEHAPTNVVCNDCNFIIASLYKRPRKV